MSTVSKAERIYTKAISEVIDFTESTKTVKVVWSTMDMKDFDGEIILSGAYTKTIAERGPKGKNLIYPLKDHMWRTDCLIGKLQELYVDGQKLIAIVAFDENDPAEMLTYSKYKRGDYKQHSVGIVPIKYTDHEDRRELQEVMLLEGSIVLWGANIETPTLEVKTAYQENPLLLYDEIISDMSALKTNLKKNMTEQDILFASQNIEDKIAQLKSLPLGTKPDSKKSTSPLTVREEVDKFLFGK